MKRRHKYGAVKTVFLHHTYDSKMEARRAQELHSLLRVGEILWWMPHPRFDLLGDVKYTADFFVIGTDCKVWVEDVKGVERPEFKIKKQLWAKTPGLPPLHIRDAKGVTEIVESDHV